MRTLALAFFACTLLSFPLTPAIGQEADLSKMDVPGAVAVSQDGPGQWVYRSFPSFMPLYVFDGDPPGKSTCDFVCTAVWPLLHANNKDKPVGDWTIILRDDGRKQWAYKNRPVYMYYDDTSGHPKGVGLEENWYYQDITSTRVANPSGNKPTWQLIKP